MGNQTRERVGLIIFFVLMLLGGVVLISYFATGLTWTVYATSVDDRVGNMEGYAVVVFPGTVDADDDALARGGAPDADAAAADQVDPLPAIADTIGLRVLSHHPAIGMERYSGVFVSDVRELYELKDASVATIDAEDILEEPVPRIMDVGGHRIGVFGVCTYKTKQALAKLTAMLEREGAETVVCVTKRMALLASVQGIDVVILTEAAPLSMSAAYREDGTLIVQAPRTGEAGVVLFSNNNVASARSIDAL